VLGRLLPATFSSNTFGLALEGRCSSAVFGLEEATKLGTGKAANPARELHGLLLLPSLLGVPC
jgi:hypothetical protein